MGRALFVCRNNDFQMAVVSDQNRHRRGSMPVWCVKVAGGIGDGNARMWRRIIADTDQHAISRTQVCTGFDFQEACLLDSSAGNFATGLS